MDDSPFNSSYFWSPVPTVQGQVETNSLLEMSWKFTWSSGLCYVKRSPEGLIRLAVSGRTLKLPADSDLTLFSLLLTLSDNYSLNLSLKLWKRECWCLREFIWWHEHFCFTSSTTVLPGFVNMLRLTWLLSFLTFFSLHHHHIHLNHLLSDSSSRPITLCPTFCAAFFFCFGHFLPFFPMVSAFPFLIFIIQSSSSPHLVLPSFWNVSSSFLLCYFTFLLSFLLPPTCPSTHHHIDGERHVPEQNQGAAGSREGQRALLPSLLRIVHLLTPLPHGCARHSWIGGGRARGACGPQAGRKWGFCRRRRWWEQQQRWTSQCGWRTPAPVPHLSEHHRCACTLHGYHDCGWVASFARSPSSTSCLPPFPYRSHVLCAPFSCKRPNSGTRD